MGMLWGLLTSWTFVLVLVVGALFLWLLTFRRRVLYVPTDGLVSGVVGRMGTGKSLFLVTTVLLPYCRALVAGGVWRDSEGIKHAGRVDGLSGRPMVRVVTNFLFDPPEALAGIDRRVVEPEPGLSVFSALLKVAESIGETEGPWKDDRGKLHPWTEKPPAGVRRLPAINGLVILDELHLFCSASDVTVAADASYFFTMARKLNCEVWWASQSEMKVHKRIRDESSELWLCARLGGIVAALAPGWHVARSYETPQQIDKARAAAGLSGGRVKPPVPTAKRAYRGNRRVFSFYNSFDLLLPDDRRTARTVSVAGDVASRYRVTHNATSAPALGAIGPMSSAQAASDDVNGTHG